MHLGFLSFIILNLWIIVVVSNSRVIADATGKFRTSAEGRHSKDMGFSSQASGPQRNST